MEGINHVQQIIMISVQRSLKEDVRLRDILFKHIFNF